MAVSFRPAKRLNIGLLLMLAGGTGSGKTWTAMELAKGMAGGQRFFVCDTERGRASMYADSFDFDVFELDAPFSSERYLEVVLAAEKAGAPVLVIDSMSHEWEGPGGLLDEHERLMGGDQAKNLSAWIQPKMAHRKFVNRLLQAKPHVIMCFRAAERVEVIDDPERRGKKKIVPKQSMTGLDGWLPITEKNLPFEATASFLLMAQRPGVPLAIKLPDPLRPLVPLDRPLTARVGEALAQWAAGGALPSNGAAARVGLRDDLVQELVALKKRADPPDEWTIEKLTELGVTVAGEKVTLATLRRMSEEQAHGLLDALNGALAAKEEEVAF